MSIILRDWKEKKIKSQLDVLIKEGLAEKVADELTVNDDFKNFINNTVISNVDDYTETNTFTNLINKLTNIKNVNSMHQCIIINKDFSIDTDKKSYYLFQINPSKTISNFEFLLSYKNLHKSNGYVKKIDIFSFPVENFIDTDTVILEVQKYKTSLPQVGTPMTMLLFRATSRFGVTREELVSINDETDRLLSISIEVSTDYSNKLAVMGYDI